TGTRVQPQAILDQPPPCLVGIWTFSPDSSSAVTGSFRVVVLPVVGEALPVGKGRHDVLVEEECPDVPLLVVVHGTLAAELPVKLVGSVRVGVQERVVADRHVIPDVIARRDHLHLIAGTLALPRSLVIALPSSAGYQDVLTAWRRAMQNGAGKIAIRDIG